MWKVLITCISLNLCLVFCMYVEKPGPRYPPTKGEVWPKPKYQSGNTTFFTFSPSHFSTKMIGQNCTIFNDALLRYNNEFRRLKSLVKRLSTKRHHGHLNKRAQLPALDVDEIELNEGFLEELLINIKLPCEHQPYFGMDESYELTVSRNAIIKANTIWGALRALETFTQLLYISDTYNAILINATEIKDEPRYSHRGLLLDTGRHYLSVHNLLTILEAMAINKMNVFHWHIVDDQSFPYQSAKLPELSAQGAYHPMLIYTKKDIKKIINFARERGIRVIPEFDVPGHTRSWGVAYPDVLTKCYANNELLGLGPMNPINNATYDLVRELFQEVQELFPDRYFHVGGDEVELNCWLSNPDIIKFMKETNIKSASKLHEMFMSNVIPMLKSDKTAIVWQEVFDNSVPINKDTLIQVWKSTEELNKVLNAGHLALFSSSWYLDHLATGGDFLSFYKADPTNFVSNKTLATNVMGGEACMWGEVVDDRNVISRVWPRASAVAERLWSPPSTDTENEVHCRLEEHTCRMIRRGIAAQPPSGPGFCVA